jgi:hypothetical protein
MTEPRFLSLHRKLVRVIDFTDDDWTICTASKMRFQMVVYDKADEDDMAVLAMMRTAGLPKGALALGVTEINEQMGAAMAAQFEQEFLKEAGVKLN